MSDETASPSQIKTSWLIGVAAAFLIFVFIGSYSVRMTNDYPDYDSQRAAQRYDTLKKVQEAEQKLLVPVDAKGNPTAEWVDQTKGTIRIPIEEAMAKELDDLKAKPAAMAADLAPAAPATAPAPATPAAKMTPAPATAPSTNAQAAAKPKEEKK